MESVNLHSQPLAHILGMRVHGVAGKWGVELKRGNSKWLDFVNRTHPRVSDSMCSLAVI